MNRDIFIRNLTKDRIEMSPKGRNANELTPEEFEKCYENFFDMIFEIAATDISSNGSSDIIFLSASANRCSVFTCVYKPL